MYTHTYAYEARFELWRLLKDVRKREEQANDPHSQTKRLESRLFQSHRRSSDDNEIGVKSSWNTNLGVRKTGIFLAMYLKSFCWL